MEEIFSDARASYNGVSRDLAPDVGDSLKRLSADLDKLAGLGAGGDAREVSMQVATQLDGLTDKAGFAARPAMTELANQYRAIGASNGAPPTLGAPNLKLMVARTYTLLSSEVKSTKFKL